jgi:hypothetical protein
MTQLPHAVTPTAAAGCTGRIVFGRIGQNGQLVFNQHAATPVISKRDNQTLMEIKVPAGCHGSSDLLGRNRAYP